MRRLITPALAVCAVLCWWVFVASVSPLLSGASNQTAITTCNTAGSCRTALGLGTASTLDVGTGANNIVQLNGSAALPAISGANLTSLPASSYSAGGATSWGGTTPSTDNAAIDRLAEVAGALRIDGGNPVAGALMDFNPAKGARSLAFEAIATVDDQTASNYDATQSTDANKPTFIPGFGGARAHAQFTSASNHYMTFSTAMGKPANWTVFIVVNVTSNSVRQAVAGSIDSGAASAKAWGHIEIANSVTGTVFYSFGDGTNASAGRTTNAVISPNVWNVICVRYTSGQNAAEVWVNGTSAAITTSLTAATSTAGTAEDFAVGRAGAYNGNYTNGRIQRLIVYSSSLANGDVTSVNNYLTTLYRY